VYTATEDEVANKMGVLFFFKFIDEKWVFSSEAKLSRDENA